MGYIPLIQYAPIQYHPSVPAATPVESLPGRVATEEKPDEEKEEQKPGSLQVLQAIPIPIGYPTTGLPVGYPAVTHVTYPGQTTLQNYVPTVPLPEKDFPVLPHSED